MENNQPLILRRDLTTEALAMIQALAPIIHQSRLFGVATADQAAAIMLSGHSYGFDYITSFRVIHIIEGKPSLAPAAAWGIVLNSDLLEKYSIEDIVDDKGAPCACRVTMERKGLQPYTITYTLDDARGAGLTEGSLKPDGSKRGRGNWEKYPANMLRWRAIGYCCDVLFADLMIGFKRADEFGAAVDYDGNIIDEEV